MQFGKYVVIEQIGEGGFGRIYKGYDPALKRVVAIKTCALSTPGLRERFVREAEIAANLHNPNIVTIFDFGMEAGEPYLVQEYLEGEDLDAVIKRRDPLPLDRRIEYLLQIARGLAFAHSRGVVHRDVKPANMRLQPDGVVRIMDFGIAKLMEAEKQLTQIGMSVGTVGYLSPEQLRGLDVDHRADIFSFGVLAYELITYQKPFDGDSLTAIFFAIAHDAPRPLPELLPGCPPRLAACIERCLSKDREARYASLAGVIADLEELSRPAGVTPHAAWDAAPPAMPAAAPGTAPGTAPSVMSGGPAVEPTRRPRPAMWGFLAAALAVAVFGVINVARWGGTSPAAAGDEPAPPESGVARASGVEDSMVGGGVATDAMARGTAGPVAEGPVAAPASGEPSSHTMGDQPARGTASPSTVARAEGRQAGGEQGRPRAETSSPAEPAAAAVSLRVDRVLVLLGGTREGLDAAESSLIRELLESGMEVVEGVHVDAVRVNAAALDAARRGEPGSLGALGRQYGAGTVLVGEITADAQPSVGRFYTGSATLSLKTYETSSGRLVGSEAFRVGAGQTPGKLGATTTAALADAASDVGRRAGRAAVQRIDSLRR